jgi:hypothetical protein
MIATLTVPEAARRARTSEEKIHAALRVGDLRSLHPDHVDNWRRGHVATTDRRMRTPSSES